MLHVVFFFLSKLLISEDANSFAITCLFEGLSICISLERERELQLSQVFRTYVPPYSRTYLSLYYNYKTTSLSNATRVHRGRELDSHTIFSLSQATSLTRGLLESRSSDAWLFMYPKASNKRLFCLCTNNGVTGIQVLLCLFAQLLLNT